MSTELRFPPRPVESHLDARELISRVDHAAPLEPFADPSSPATILLKREDMGPNGSFKWRGALCALADFASSGARSAITASTGNHGAAVAWAARRLGIEAHVVVPADASGIKCSLIEQNGASLYRQGANLAGAVRFAGRLARELDAPYFEDGSARAQLLGTATIGHEIVAELGGDVDVVVAPLAVGALAGGIGLGLEEADSAAELYGVQAEGFDAITRRLAGRSDDPVERPTFADGLADNRIVDPAFSACADHLAGTVVVSDAALEQAISELHAAHGIVVEGAGAAALAGMRALELDRQPGRRIVLVVSGRNIDPKIAERLLGRTGPGWGR